MGADNKVHNATEDALGHIKEAVGGLTHDQTMQAEGKADEAKANLGKAAENVKDAVQK